VVINIPGSYAVLVAGMSEVDCGKRVDNAAVSRSWPVRVSIPRERLDEAKIETLRAWGEGLRSDPRDEVRAAGRAITLLVEEIERLNIDLWHARTDPRESAGEETPADSAARPLPPPLPDYRTAYSQ
jgi:hypothetical protein